MCSSVNRLIVSFIIGTNSITSNLILGIFAKVENSEAIRLRLSIWFKTEWASLTNTLAKSFFLSLCAATICWMDSFIGVNGFFISWATCLAISFQAFSLSSSAISTWFFCSSLVIDSKPSKRSFSSPFSVLSSRTLRSPCATDSVALVNLLIGADIWFAKTVLIIMMIISAKE